MLTPDQRKRFYVLQALVIFMGIMEVVGVASIAPFMMVAGDMSRLEGDGLLARVYVLSGASSPRHFLFYLGVFVLFAMCASTIISIITTWRMSTFATSTGQQLSQRLYLYYMHQPWLFHSSENSSRLTKQIAAECGRVTTSILNPLVHINAKLVMLSMMGLGLLAFEPYVALIGLAVFFGVYFFLYKSVSKVLSRNGKQISKHTAVRFKLLSEGFGGIKDLLLLGRQGYFTEKFSANGVKLAKYQAVNQAIAEIPRYLIQLVVFGGVLLLVLYLMRRHQGDLGGLLSVLSVYAFAGFKMIPAFQQVYAYVAKVRGNIAAFESIKNVLQASRSQYASQEHRESMKAIECILDREKMPLHGSIRLHDISFRYPGKKFPVLDRLSAELPAYGLIGIVGMSGSGKSTLVDVILGLIKPDDGFVSIDGIALSDENLRAWQNSIGYVSQSIFLADYTLRDNIAFGVEQHDIDEEKIQSAIVHACLDSLVNQLPHGLDTKVGERGIQLSGGQRQRIGIARALYADPEILVLDEATSSLDGITEKYIMDAVQGLRGKKTIVMIAHRIKTVKNCDIIFVMDKGKIAASGSYQKLIRDCAQFKKMVEHV